MSFGVDVPMSNMDIKNTVLPELYFSYRENEVRFHKLGQLIRGANSPQSKLTAEDVQKFSHAYQDLGNRLYEILKKGRACLVNDANCIPPMAPLVYPIDWPRALFETKWMDTDESGQPYIVQFTVPAHNLRKQIRSGTFELPLSSAKIFRVDYSCSGPICGYSYNRDPAKGHDTDVVMNADGKSFTWYRRWDGDEHDEMYTVHYQVQRVICVENCDYEMALRDSRGKIAQTRPDWNKSPQPKKSVPPDIAPKK
jgi:hypothetical protein